MEVSQEKWDDARLYTVLMYEVKQGHECLRMLLEGRLVSTRCFFASSPFAA